MVRPKCSDRVERTSAFRLQLIRFPDFTGRQCASRVHETEGVRSRTLQSNSRAQSAKLLQRTSEKILRSEAMSASSPTPVEPSEHKYCILALLASHGDWDFPTVDRATDGVRAD